MRIFLSYSASDRALAQATDLSLRGAGYKVFFDRNDLPAGESFDVRILEAIEKSDLLVYLISPASVEPGAYALTELGFARKRWRHPDRRIIPVLVRPVAMDALPAYLRAVTLLEPEGDVVAEILTAVTALSGWRRYKRRIAQSIAASVVIVGLVAIIVLWRATQESDCAIAAAAARNVAERMLDLVAEAERQSADWARKRFNERTYGYSEIDQGNRMRREIETRQEQYGLETTKDSKMQSLASRGQEASTTLSMSCGAKADNDEWSALIKADNLNRHKFSQLATALLERAVAAGR